MATHSNGISALQLQKQLGLGSYKSAWLLCAKLRRAMVAPGRAPLAGLVEVDETEIPLRTKTDPVCGGGGRSPQGKMFVAGAVEVENDAPGRLRLAAIKDFSAASLHGFVAANVAPGATIKTDGWPSYARAPDVRHEPHVVGAMAAHVVLPWVHRAFSNAKTWALGVYHGLRRQHLQSYLDEFAFRFNRRRTRHAAFRSLLAIALVRKPLTYNMLIMPESSGISLPQVMETLINNLANLTNWEQSFAISLLDQLSYRSLSDKRLWELDALANKSLYNSTPKWIRPLRSQSRTGA